MGNCYFFSPFGQDIYKDTFDPNSGFNQVFSVNPATGERIQVPDETVFEVINWFLGEVESYDERDLNVFDVIASGTLMELPAGELGLAFGYQRRWDRFKRFDSYFDQSFIRGFKTPGIGGKGNRSVDAYFAELFIPVAESLDVQLAVRRESYDQGLGSTTDPKVGINFRPVEWLTLRGSYSTAYRTPSLKQVVGTDASSRLRSVEDPLDPTEFGVGNLNFRTARIAKNPDLLPEESTNYNIGVSFLPTLPWGDESHSLQIDVDYFDFDFENRIELKGAQEALSLDPCGPNVIRDPVVFISDPLLVNDPTGNCGSGPVGEILIIDQTYNNSGGTTTSGFDVSAVYTFDINDVQMSIR
ncbi:MAG: TonB-dependent receptor, partial [Gammaproteobacteria bacterium]|nr:TonB-dependent receptor [Gammaproteobacteria bacterium]